MRFCALLGALSGISGNPTSCQINYFAISALWLVLQFTTHKASCKCQQPLGGKPTDFSAAKCDWLYLVVVLESLISSWGHPCNRIRGSVNGGFQRWFELGPAFQPRFTSVLPQIYLMLTCGQPVISNHGLPSGQKLGSGSPNPGKTSILARTCRADVPGKKLRSDKLRADFVER